MQISEQRVNSADTATCCSASMRSRAWRHPDGCTGVQIDFLSADADKWLLGPEGIGLFYCRKGLSERLSPPLVGWKSVQNEFAFEQPDFRLKTSALRFEEGSMNLLGIFGLGAAIDLLLEIGIADIEKRVLGPRRPGHPGRREESLYGY